MRCVFHGFRINKAAPTVKRCFCDGFGGEASVEQIVRTLILHFVALTSVYSPNGNNFENALATQLANLITPKRKAMMF